MYLERVSEKLAIISWQPAAFTAQFVRPKGNALNALYQLHL
jgi:hypothetical protein